MLRLISGQRDPERPTPPPEPRHDELAPLASRVIAGDREALRTFLAIVTPHLLRVVRRVLGSAHPDVEDVTQEAALGVVQALGRFRQEGTVLHFACRIGVLSAMNARRRDATQKRARGAHEADPEEVAGDTLSPESAAIGSALAPIVRELLDALPEPLAEALALHCVLGHTVAEVAASSGVPLETVRSRLRLAKQALRKRILGDPWLRRAVEEEP
jgi:RNA polymerase sigma factor (sigma-70 family)